MASTSSSIAAERPGADPSRPHQDLRIPSRVPSRLLSQAVPSSSSSSSSHQSQYSTPPVAVQIASLHRAAEVARFEWRASQAERQRLLDLSIAQQSSTSTSRYVPRVDVGRAASVRHTPRSAFSSSSPTSASVRVLGEELRASAPRLYSSSLEAYISAAQDISPTDQTTEALSIDLHADTDSESDDTEDDVIASTLRTSYERRRGSYRSAETNDDSASFQRYAEDVAAESQVWDRMLDDLAIGAGLHGRSTHTGYSPYSRGISGGIAASMLALSAAVPRPDSNAADPQRRGHSTASSRLLPHPIWARRYPGAAGEWLRGELARRAQVPMRGEQQADSRESRTAAQRVSRLSAQIASDRIFRANGSLESSGSSSSSTSPWSVLQFPSLDPSTQRRSRVAALRDESIPAAVASDPTGGNSLAVPSNATALAPTPPPETAVDEQNRPVVAENNSNHRARASEIVARMANELRERNAASNLPVQVMSETPHQAQSRALRGGMEYIRRLRAIDAAEERRRVEEQEALVDRLTTSNDSESEPSSPPQPHEVFPWYHPPATSERLLERMNNMTIADGTAWGSVHSFDPDGTHLASRIHATAMSAQWDLNDDPNGERFESDDDNDDPVLRRRLLRASAGMTSAAQRHRNRSALVISSEEAEEGMHNLQPANAADGWTVINARPSSPVRQTRDEGSQNVTTWFRGPAMSSSPRPMDDDGYDSSRPQPAAVTDQTRARRNSASTVNQPVTHSPRGFRDFRSPTTPIRRAEYSSSVIRGDADAFGLRSLRRFGRESTPSPEPRRVSNDRNPVHTASTPTSEAIARTRHLTNIGAQLEEEFRARQGELQQREDNLRTEVARRRVELDELRRQQGRIGRVLERSRMEQPNENGYDLTWDAATTPDNENTAAPHQDTPSQLTRQTSTGSASLVRRNAVRESLLRAPRRSSEYDSATFNLSGIR